MDSESQDCRVVAPFSARYRSFWRCSGRPRAWPVRTDDSAFPSLLTPRIDGDPRQSGFRPAGRNTATPGPQVFKRPPAAGAGNTGFNSTNIPRQKVSPLGSRSGNQQRAVVPPPLPLPTTATPAARRAAQRAQADRIATGSIGIESPYFYQPPIRRIPEDDTAFDPLGWRAGAFLIKPAVELSGGFDSNPARVPGGATGSGLYVIAPELLVRSDWRRHALNADLRGSYTGYQSGDVSDRPSVDAKVDGRIDVLRDTSIDLQGRLLVGTDNPGSLNVQGNLSRLPVYSNTGFTAGVTQRFNRFEVSAKANVDRTQYQNSSFTNGATASNEDRNYNQYGGVFRGSYETLPGVKPFVEIATDQRAHDLRFDRSGLQRDSNGRTYRAGASFSLPRRLTGEISAGYTTRDYKDPSLTSLSGFVFDSSLAGTATPLTTLTLVAKSAVNELTLPGMAGYLSRDVGLQVDHAFRRYLTATLKAGIGFDTYDSIGRNDQRQLLSAGFIYKATREVHLKGEVRHEWLTSSLPGLNYSADIFTLGVRLQR